jgi:hypothetical protein
LVKNNTVVETVPADYVCPNIVEIEQDELGDNCLVLQRNEKRFNSGRIYQCGSKFPKKQDNSNECVDSCVLFSADIKGSTAAYISTELKIQHESGLNGYIYVGNEVHNRHEDSWNKYRTCVNFSGNVPSCEYFSFMWNNENEKAYFKNPDVRVFKLDDMDALCKLIRKKEGTKIEDSISNPNYVCPIESKIREMFNAKPYLIHGYNRQGYSPLMCACAVVNDGDFIRKLIYGEYGNEKPELNQRILINGNYNFVKNKYGESWLLKCLKCPVEKNDLSESVRILLASGANPMFGHDLTEEDLINVTTNPLSKYYLKRALALRKQGEVTSDHWNKIGSRLNIQNLEKNT